MNTRANKGVVLLVDDEAIIRESLHQWLEMEDFRVFSAANGEEALQICKTEKLDVGVFDIRMPGMDGITLLSHTKSYCPELSVIMMTAFASIEDAVRCISQGAHDYIIKPFPPEKLTQSIHHIMDARRLHQQNQKLQTNNKLLAEFWQIAQPFISLGVATTALAGASWARPVSDPDTTPLIEKALQSSRIAFETQPCSLQKLVDLNLALLQVHFPEIEASVLVSNTDANREMDIPVAAISLGIQILLNHLLQRFDSENIFTIDIKTTSEKKPMLQFNTPGQMSEEDRKTLDGQPAYHYSHLVWAAALLKTLGVDISASAVDDGEEVKLIFLL